MTPPDDPIALHVGDCRAVLPSLGLLADACVTDPPYELPGGFMGKAWDRSGVSFDPATWAAVLNAVKPGGYLLAFAGSRTQHRIGCAIEDGGWEVRDTLLWLYGTGFPKGKGCLKPAYEPIILARRPGPKVLPLGVDECRVPTDEVGKPRTDRREDRENWRLGGGSSGSGAKSPAGRYPANVLHSGEPEVLEAFAAFGDDKGGRWGKPSAARSDGYHGDIRPGASQEAAVGDTTGTAARFFYAAKASKKERGEGNTHPTVKPLSLLRWLVRLACPAGGTVLDCFAGSGTTGRACQEEGRRAVLIEQDQKYADTIRKRLSEGRTLFNGGRA